MAKSKGIQSVEIGTRVLEALAESGANASLTKIANTVGLSPSQAHRYLAAHVNSGMASKNNRNGNYQLGPKVLRLGLVAYAKQDVSVIVNQAVEEVVERTQLSGLVSVWGDQGPVIIRWVHGRVPVATSLGLGSVLSVTSSSAGHTFISYLPAVMWEPLVEAELGQARDPRMKLQELADETRRRGFARVSGSVVPGLHAISAPVLNKDGEAVAVVGIIDRVAKRFKGSSNDIRTLLEVCGQASRSLGFGTNDDASE